MEIRLNRAHHPVTVLGHGRRIGLWLQGCSIRCEGCIARDTWEDEPDRGIPVESLLDWCRAVASADDAGVDGVTISGGEPFDQPEALLELLQGLRVWAAEGGGDLVCYSGREESWLRRRHPECLALLDVLIPNPYVAGRAPGRLWRGSDNQPMVLLTDLARSRYADAVDHAPEAARMQVAVDGTTAYYIGVPLPGDLERLGEALQRRGFSEAGASWRS